MTVTPLAAELVQRTSRSEAIELREQLFVVGPGGGVFLRWKTRC